MDVTCHLRLKHMHTFLKLADVSAGEAKEANKVENKEKNRYKALCPADRWRVILDKTMTKDGSDYINASFIKSYTGEEKYIAAQSPMKQTVADFVLMIWQVKSSAVVILTENLERDCEQYWPNGKETVNFHEISVERVSEEYWKDFTVRTLKFTMKNESRVLKQFHFHAWPYTGVPEHKFLFIMFYRLLHSHIKDDSSPVIVHCSDGVGRTGTFIGLDYLMDEARATGKYDPISCIEGMRMRRPEMVKNEGQYYFLNDILLEMIIFPEMYNFHASQFQLNQLESQSKELRVEPKQVDGMLKTARRGSVIFSNFQKLADVKPAGTSLAADKPENRKKNRYWDQKPADQWRVILDATETRDGSDYINASYMTGYTRENKYIATQGPMSNTIDDFWLMVWQVQPCGIVMLTNCFEYGQSQCERYWPDEGASTTFHKISVSVVSEERWSDFTVRTCKLSKAGEMFMTKQFHFHSWPTNGVPIEKFPFIVFYRLVNSCIKDSKQPLVVHCSFGIGRTGTFIALDYLMDEARTTGSFHPSPCIAQMRERRPAMIRNEAQYYFLNDALLEILIVEKYVCPANLLLPKLKMYEANTKAGSSISSEFENIAKLISWKTYQYDTGMLAVNKKKNRYQHILPNELYMPYLSIEGSTGGYINAVLVDGYRFENFIICTQLPLHNTLADFWQMVVHNESSVIVQLDDEKFWEMESEKVYNNNIRVTLFSAKLISGYRISKFHVYFKEKKRDVYLIQVVTSNKRLPDCSKALEVLSQVEKKIEKTFSKTVIFASLDGAKMCGLFSCAMNVLQKLKREGEVDIYNFVLNARCRRQQICSSLEEYVWLHRVVAEYINTELY